MTISILIGAISHILWDSFTHDNGYFVQTIPTLTKALNFFGRQVPILKILQHTSTLIGGLIILFAIYKLPKSNIGKENINLKYWIIIVILTFTIVAVRLLGGLELKQYGNLIVTAISAGMISLTLTSLILKKKKNWR